MISHSFVPDEKDLQYYFNFCFLTCATDFYILILFVNGVMHEW